ncbi:hypothetical protein [Spirosoma pollinicola]|uniref:Uncharacterized protein n=1 Tax=Spirosoma pollinicola TaxID=2057025 RepID=A0A2K8Z2C6_9BACT|nr:hypothetical protein [Spirosoma pollinicola]AUD04015.1 hypothetical protein CWM47_20605 [Spirosoma pollinicola]
MIRSLLKELVNRIEHLREVLSRDDFNPHLNQLFLKQTETRLHSLKMDVLRTMNDSSWGIPGTNANFYSDYQRSNEHLLQLEYYGVQVLKHFGEPELYFNALMRQLWQEMGVSGTPPLVTTISTNSNHFWALAAYDLIGAPPGEEAHLLNIPDLLHETGHVLLNYHNVSYPNLTGSINEVIDQVYQTECWAVEDQERSKELLTTLNQWKTRWHKAWQAEFACDLIATYFLGPAYAWTNVKLSVSERLGDVYDTQSESHPSHEARMRCINGMLMRMGHVQEADQIAKLWQEFLTLPAYNQPLHYDMAFPDELISQLTQNVYEGCRNQDWLSYGDQCQQVDQPIASLLNEAWEILLNRPEEYSQFEQKTVARLWESFRA